MRNKSHRFISGLLLLPACGAASAWATTYQVIDLNPQPGYPAYWSNYGVALGGGEAVGYGSSALQTNNHNHALLWNGSGMVDLTPANCVASGAVGTDGVQQAGWITTATNYTYGVVWNGSAGSYVNLTPAGATTSQVYGMGGGQEVGTTSLNNGCPALWNGTAASFVDLQPAGWYSAAAYATDGVHQVGQGYNTVRTDAMMWSGNAGSAVDLNTGQWAGDSEALGVALSEIVGWAKSTTYSYPHAILWTNLGGGAVDLNPAGCYQSQAMATNGYEQVGWALGNAGYQAYLWNGSPNGVDLNAYLPSWATSAKATGIDARGDVIGYAADGYGRDDAVIWQVVPEPASLALIALGGVGILARRRRAM